MSFRDPHRLHPPSSSPPPSTVLSDQLLALGLTAGGLGVGLVWSTGQLAGLVFGQDWLQVGLPELGHVLTNLHHHLGDPQLAWPAAAREELPGPAGMYSSLAATTAAGAWVAVKTVQVKERLFGDLHRPRKAGWGAGWATARQLHALTLRRPAANRVVIGAQQRLGRRLLAAEDCHSVLVFGPPGSYKTAGLVIPAVLEWTGPLVATSVKLDVLDATRAHRSGRGEVLVFDPLGTSGRAGQRWSPLRGCAMFAGAQAMADAMAAAAEPTQPGVSSEDSNHRYWTDLAAKLLAPVLFAAAGSGASMRDVVCWVDRRTDDDITKLLGELGNELAVDAWEATQARIDKAHDSVYSTAEHLLRIYGDERVTRFTAGDDLDPEAFLSGDNTLYLIRARA